MTAGGSLWVPSPHISPEDNSLSRDREDFTSNLEIRVPCYKQNKMKQNAFSCHFDSLGQGYVCVGLEGLGRLGECGPHRVAVSASLQVMPPATRAHFQWLSELSARYQVSWASQSKAKACASPPKSWEIPQIFKVDPDNKGLI